MFEGRHPGTLGILKFFSAAHLPIPLQMVSLSCAHLADEMVSRLPDSPELIAGLRKLLEAKDCFVRATVLMQEEMTNEVRGDSGSQG